MTGATTVLWNVSKSNYQTWTTYIAALTTSWASALIPTTWITTSWCTISSNLSEMVRVVQIHKPSNMTLTTTFVTFSWGATVWVTTLKVASSWRTWTLNCIRWSTISCDMTFLTTYSVRNLFVPLDMTYICSMTLAFVLQYSLCSYDLILFIIRHILEKMIWHTTTVVAKPYISSVVQGYSSLLTMLKLPS